MIGAVFAEWVGANSGLGYLIRPDNAQLETARLFAAVDGPGRDRRSSLFGLLALAERRVVTWR